MPQELKGISNAMNHLYATETMLVEECREKADLMVEIQKKVLVLAAHSGLCDLLLLFHIEYSNITVCHFIESGGLYNFVHSNPQIKRPDAFYRTYTMDDIHRYTQEKGRSSKYTMT